MGVERCKNISSENKRGGSYVLTGVLNHLFQTHIKHIRDARAQHPTPLNWFSN